MKNLLKSIKSVWCALLMLPTWLLVVIKQNPRLKDDIVDVTIGNNVIVGANAVVTMIFQINVLWVMFPLR